MATQKPISSISYNTEPFLRSKLDSWYSAHIIQAYQYIFHKGEDGDKDHIHFRVEPNKRVDPMVLQDELKEYLPGCDKPLCCRPFRPSKEEDWILYAVHDEEYLKLKYKGGEKGEKILYNWQDIKVPENYDIEIAFVRAKSALEHGTVNLASRLRNGEKPVDLIMQGENIYTIGALNRILAEGDYQRVLQDLNLANARFEKLLTAIYAYGLSVESDENGNIYLINPKEKSPDDE